MNRATYEMQWAEAFLMSSQNASRLKMLHSQSLGHSTLSRSEDRS